MLILCAPFLAILVERYLDLPEKTALLILSLAFIASVIGRSVGKGLVSMGLGLLAAYVGIGEVPKSIEDLWHEKRKSGELQGAAVQRRTTPALGRYKAAVAFYRPVGSRRHGDRRRARVHNSARARLRALRRRKPPIHWSPEPILSLVLSLGIPGNSAAVFLILAADSIGGFNPGPSVFRFTADAVNPELVVAFGLFTAMFIANAVNWTFGGLFIRSMGGMVHIPKHILLPVVLLLALTAIYVQEARMEAVWFAIGFGVLGHFMRVVGMSPLPFVIDFILGGRLEESARQAYAATGGDAFFLFTHPIALLFMALAAGVIAFTMRRAKSEPSS